MDQQDLEQPTLRRDVKIRPSLFAFWTPKWRDWRGGNTGGSDTSSGSDTGNFVLDAVLDFVLPLLWDVLWDRFLWVIWGAIVWALEWGAAVVLAPFAFLGSVLGLRRHRLVAMSGDEPQSLDRGSWYAMRRALAEIRAGSDESTAPASR